MLTAPIDLAIPQTAPRFPQGSLVKHKKGGLYRILATPDLCRIEEGCTPAYVYQAVTHEFIWVRPQAEMEDGRFKEAPDYPFE